MTCTSVWNPAPASIPGAVDGSQRCASLLFCYSSQPPWKRARSFPWRPVTSEVGETHLTDPPRRHRAPFFNCARGITAPKSSFPAAAPPRLMGKSYWNSSRLLGSFDVKSCVGPLARSPSPRPFISAAPSSPDFSPPLPSAQLILIVLTGFVRVWPQVMGVITC